MMQCLACARLCVCKVNWQVEQVHVPSLLHHVVSELVCGFIPLYPAVHSLCVMSLLSTPHSHLLAPTSHHSPLPAPHSHIPSLPHPLTPLPSLCIHIHCTPSDSHVTPTSHHSPLPAPHSRIPSLPHPITPTSPHSTSISLHPHPSHPNWFPHHSHIPLLPLTIIPFLTPFLYLATFLSPTAHPLFSLSLRHPLALTPLLTLPLLPQPLNQTPPSPHSHVSSPSQVADQMTTSHGIPVDNKNAVLTVGERGHMLMQDIVYMDEMAHFDRERIPERVVHAKGAGERQK